MFVANGIEMHLETSNFVPISSPAWAGVRCRRADGGEALELGEPTPAAVFDKESHDVLPRFGLMERFTWQLAGSMGSNPCHVSEDVGMPPEA